MAYRATKSFSGKISMVRGEVRDILDEEVAKDLVKAGYVIDLSEKQKATKTASKKADKAGKAGDSDV